MRKSSIAFVTLTLLSALGCGDPFQGDEPEPYTVRGWTLDREGNPLDDVQIVVDDTLFVDSAVTGHTDEQGYYELAVGDGSWRTYATHFVEYEGRTFEVQLHPLQFDTFAGVDGAVCNFEWRLQGERPAPMVGTYGGTVYAYADSSVAMATDLELLFEPVGPLIDGSEGETLVLRPDSGGLIEDVPIGRYAISVVNARTGRALRLKLQTDDGGFKDEVDTVFEPLWERELCEDCIRLEIAE